VWEADREEIRRRIAEGEGTMPAFGDKLSPRELDTLVGYVLEIAGPPDAG
jgi:mono/diheme cytochrome c family protein